MAKQAVVTTLSNDTTLEQDRAVTKIAEGLTELGVSEHDALEQAEDLLDYAKIVQHMDAAAAF